MAKEKKIRKPRDKSKGFIGEFKKFITRGNIIDLAVGVIIGGAFSAIVTALTNKIIMPLINAIISLCTGGSSLDIITPLNGAARYLEDGSPNPQFIYIDWGAFIQAIINFLLIAFVLFILVKTINSLNDRKVALEKKRLEAYYEEHPEERPVPPVAKPSDNDLLVEIRDLLKEQNKKKEK